ncbi:Sof1-like rRNA processing protein (contains WD40 repeats) [Phaffia rhodozyma]|uniref:Sof1-like rRNA processing protein (Contains WD40 repeats) n=1 Tax=Phaffia rhodozyma TaxID=264483 RepID=A0A0F7SJR1_PHARH|nr:Sof1-like rRNA processing protein (contains WD40 repeats) [Phaffia rhodozyma]
MVSVYSNLLVYEDEKYTHLPTTAGASAPVHRNLDPALHPFSKQREYTRAVNAAKIDRMFAKPFVAALEGHTDGVYTLGRDPRRTDVVAGGGGDGEIILHSLSGRKPIVRIPDAHRGQVTGLCFSADNNVAERRLISCGRDQTIKIWSSPSLTQTGISEEQPAASSSIGRPPSPTPGITTDDFDPNFLSSVNLPPPPPPLFTYSSKYAFQSISHHRSDPVFATASNCVQIWDETKSSPLSTLKFGATMESVLGVRFNQSERSVLASVGSERTMCLYDIRTGKAERQVRMTMKSNSLSWCPTLPTVLLLASEDHNLYTFDIRNLASPTQIYKDHVAAVMSCDWSPTGEEFVSGGWDRSVRIWDRTEGKSKDVYHTKRMQRVMDVAYTPTSTFVMSASDDGNIRLWKSKASASLGVVDSRERASREYRAKLVDKWGKTDAVRRIEKRRHIPSSIHNATKLKREMIDARKAKEENRRRHTKAGLTKPKAEKKKVYFSVSPPSSLQQELEN